MALLICSLWTLHVLLSNVTLTLAPREIIEDLHRTLPKASRQKLSSAGVVNTYLAHDGRRRICGGPKLKGTQTYTKTFAMAVASLHHRRTMKQHLKPAARRLSWVALPPVTPQRLAELDSWDDAKLDSVRAFIERRGMRLQPSQG